MGFNLMLRMFNNLVAAAFGHWTRRPQMFCEDCRRQFKTVWRVTRYSADEPCSYKMIRSMILAFKSGCGGCVRATYARIGSAGRHAKETERGQLTLKSCPNCADELLSFEFQRYAARRWETVDESSITEVFSVGYSAETQR